MTRSNQILLSGAFALLLPAGIARADDVGPSVTLVGLSDSGKFLFLMMPPSEEFYADFHLNSRQSVGVCYKVSGDGTLEEFWRMKGAYSSQVFLWDDGEHLACIGPWNIGTRPRPTDLAVAFYKRGNLLRRYSTLELVEDPLEVEPSTSHYEWKDRASPVRLGRGVLSVKTINGISYEFDETGKIRTKQLPKRKAQEPSPAGSRTPTEALESFRDALARNDTQAAAALAATFTRTPPSRRDAKLAENLASDLMKSRQKLGPEGWNFEIIEEKVVDECAVVVITQTTTEDPAPVYLLREPKGWCIVPPFGEWIATEFFQKQSSPVFRDLEEWFDERQVQGAPLK